MGKWLIAIGVFFIVAGLVVLLANKLGLPLGRMPGDIQVKGESFSFYFPVVTSIILSIVLTVVIAFARWFMK